MKADQQEPGPGERSGPTSGGGAPGDEYRRRLEARNLVVARLDRLDARVADLRLAVFAAALILGYLSWVRDALSAAWLLVPAAAFLGLLVAHDRLLRRRARAARAAAHYQRGLLRLDDRWAGTGTGGEGLAPAEHPYARDLDLFGTGSLFELLCSARTAAGEETLAAWLLAPAGAAELRARQGAVIELRERLELREELAILGEDVPGPGSSGTAARAAARLSAWATAAPLFGSGARTGATVLSLLGVAALLAWGLTGLGPWPLLAVLALDAGYLRLFRERLAAVAGGAERPERELSLLGAVLSRLEREPVKSPKLIALQASLGSGARAASRRIRRLSLLLELLALQQNQLLAPLGWLLLWVPHVAFLIERWRAASGHEVAAWLGAVGELEALSSLSARAYERPEDPFPEIADGGPLLEGEGLGHPLLPAASCVRNDVSLGAAPQVLVVSGSNMAGKSTLLRTVGANVVLALAGAPVRATRLTLSPVMLGATLRIEDSLQHGASRFYAEITRLKQLLDLAAGSPPLLFLLDELLHGTNSRDRQIGGQAVVQNLLARGAIGLCTTHDLALAAAATGLGTKALNVHFEDRVEGGKLVFDYKLRQGIVERSNALELLRAVGIDVAPGRG